MPSDQEETEQELLDSEDAGIKCTKVREECVMESVGQPWALQSRERVVTQAETGSSHSGKANAINNHICVARLSRWTWLQRINTNT